MSGPDGVPPSEFRAMDHDHQQQPALGPNNQQQQQQQQPMLQPDLQRSTLPHKDQTAQAAFVPGNQQATDGPLPTLPSAASADTTADAAPLLSDQGSGSMRVSNTGRIPSAYERASANIGDRFKAIKRSLMNLPDTIARDLHNLQDHPRVMFGGRARGVMVVSLPLRTRGVQVALAGCDDMDQTLHDAVMETAELLGKLLEVANKADEVIADARSSLARVKNLSQMQIAQSTKTHVRKTPGPATGPSRQVVQDQQQQQQAPADTDMPAGLDSDHGPDTLTDQEDGQEQQQRKRVRRRSCRTDRLQDLSRRVWGSLSRAGLAPTAEQQCAGGKLKRWQECQEFVVRQQQDGCSSCACGGSCCTARSALSWDDSLPLVNPNKVSLSAPAVNTLLNWVSRKQALCAADGTWPAEEMQVLINEYACLNDKGVPAGSVSSDDAMAPGAGAAACPAAAAGGAASARAAAPTAAGALHVGASTTAAAAGGAASAPAGAPTAAAAAALHVGASAAADAVAGCSVDAGTADAAPAAAGAASAAVVAGRSSAAGGSTDAAAGSRHSSVMPGASPGGGGGGGGRATTADDHDMRAAWHGAADIGGGSRGARAAADATCGLQAALPGAACGGGSAFGAPATAGTAAAAAAVMQATQGSATGGDAGAAAAAAAREYAAAALPAAPLNDTPGGSAARAHAALAAGGCSGVTHAAAAGSVAVQAASSVAAGADRGGAARASQAAAGTTGREWGVEQHWTKQGQ